MHSDQIMKDPSQVIISTDDSKLDSEVIHKFLTKSYWAKGRTLSQVETSIKSSLNFGLYLKDKQIGYARVLTDYVAFAYLMDIFILEEHRGLGYSKKLLDFIFTYQEIKVSKWMLTTRDAHSLYSKFGFNPIEKPERLMEMNGP